MNDDALSRKKSLRRALSDPEKTYGSVASALGVSKGVLWKFVNTDYVPTRTDIQRALGLTPKMRLSLLPGLEIDPDAILGSSSRTCDCGNKFVPNTAKRYNCFECVPIRRRKK